MAASLGGAMFIMAVDSSDKIKDGGIYSKLVHPGHRKNHTTKCRANLSDFKSTGTWVNDLADEVREVNYFILDHNLSQSIFNRYSNVMLLKVAETRFASNIFVVESKRSIGKTMLDLDWKGFRVNGKKDPIKLKARKLMDLLVSET
ncbi:hypothetical protein PVK06_001813 [Gossypium arboreum]|uniref:Uncharacterized protein n=1 Tax=Gossypium arboreum TaxID=29729 RepID=A0ABR0R269_GOSAR|nr:hypothetical protein PVK06_001813 [Gossypium arboreum]